MQKVKPIEQLPEEITSEYFPAFRIVGNPKDFEPTNKVKKVYNNLVPVKTSGLRSKLVKLSDLMFIQSIMLVGYLIGSLILLIGLIIIRLAIGPFYYVINYYTISRNKSNAHIINKFWNKNILWALFSVSYCFAFWYLTYLYLLK